MKPAPTTPTFSDWLEGARLRTLPAAIAPVIAGTATAGAGAHLGRAALAAIVALALQIGVNFANDYSDGIRGTDEHRVGPTRLTASGLVPPTTVKHLAFGWFAIGAIAGLVLVILSQAWWLLVAGALSIVAAWFYTGGKNPYGYRGLGEPAVFVFFGLVATLGTAYTQALGLTWSALFASFAMGFVACALLMINNVRDIATDIESGKLTLAVRLGEQKGRAVYAGFMTAASMFTLAATTTLLIEAGFLGGGMSPSGAATALLISSGLVMIGCIVWALHLGLRVVQGSTAMIPTLRDTGLVQLGIGIGLGILGVATLL